MQLVKYAQDWKKPFNKQLAEGKVGYALLWLLGVPLPLLAIFYFIRH